MTDSLSLGKKKDNRSIDFTHIRSGIRKEELLKDVDPKLKSVFEQILNEIDTNPDDNMLSRNELQAFFDKVKELAGKKDETNLSKGEAKKFEYTNEKGETKTLGRKGKDALLILLEKLNTLSKDVKITKNEDGSETNEYPDGRTERVFPDGHKIITTKSGNKTITSVIDKDDNETDREELTELSDGSTIRESYKNKKKTVKLTFTDANNYEEIKYDEKENPANKTVRQGDELRYSSYDKRFPNNWRLNQTIQKNDSEDITTDVEYAEDGAKNTETSTYVKHGQEEAYKTVNRTFEGEQVAQEVTTETGKPVVTRTYDSERNYTESYTEGGAEITESYNINEGKTAQKTSQKIVKGGQTYEVNYDENGYTTGIIVQNGETIKSIASKFGVSEKDLVAANASLLKGKRYFNVGAEIRIPTPLRADAAVLQGRKDAAGAIAEYRAEQARIAEERRQREEARINKECAELGMTSTEGAGGKIQGHYIKSPNEKKEYTVIGKCKYGTIAKDSKGNIVVIRPDGVIASKDDVKNKTKAANAQAASAQSGTAKGDTVVYNGKVYTIVDSKANAKGQIKVKGADGKEILMSKSFVEASKNLARGQGKFSLTNPKIRYAKDSAGKVCYFDEKGNVIDGAKKAEMIKAEAKKISDIIIKATYRLGTDEEALLKGIQMIYCPEILDQINATLKNKGCKDDNLTKPIEALLIEELSRSESRSYIKALANAGGYGVGAARDKAMGRNCAREIDWELHGGMLGYTGSKDLKEALGMADTRAARLETERIVGAKQTQCGKVKATKPDHGSWVRAYIAEDDWNAIQVDIFDMVWMKNNAYTHKEDQAHRNGLIERAMTSDKTDDGKKDKALVREARNIAYDAMEAGTEDETHAREVAKRENKSRGYKAQHKGQDELQTFIAGSNVGEDGKIDAAQVSANNTNLYKSSKPADIQAQEVLNYVAQGDTSHLFDSMEPEVYEKLNELTGNPNYVREMYTELMKTARGSDKMKIMSNAILSKQIEFSKQELVDFCIELMHSIDDYYGSGASSGQSAKGINISAYLTTQLKAILSQHPEILQEVKARVEKETFESSSTIYTSSSNYGARTTSTIKENRKGIYQDILNSTYTVASKSVFLDDKGNEITDSATINYIIQTQKDSLEELRKYVAELEREFNKTVDSEGNLSGTANYLSEYSGLGTDRDDVRTAYRQAKQWLNQLEAAAEGKLRDSSGKNISFQELSQRIMEKVEKLNTDYNTTISYGKMVVVMAPVILVTIPVSAGASAVAGAVGLTGAAANLLVATTAGVAAGGTTYALNYAEMTTSVTGDTMEARERNYLESSVAAFSTAIGAGQMKYICSMFNNASAITRFGGRLTTVLASDMGVAGVGEYIQSGTVTIEGMTMTLFFSLTGNLIGIKSLTMKDVPNVTPPKPHADTTPDVLDVATSHGTRNASDVHVGTKPNKKTGAAPKSQQIHNLVDDYIAEGQMTPKRTSEMREQLEQISNPDVREQNIRKLDDAARNTMSAEDYAAYRQQVETDVRKYADRVLEGTEGINPSDARRVRESFEYRTEKELEEIIAKLEPRKGRYQQGIDQADQLIKEARAILRRKTAANADISSLTADLDACIAGKRGLNETERAKLKEVLPKLTEDADIQAFLSKWKQIEKPSTSDKSFVRKTLEAKGYIKDSNGNFVKKGAGVNDASEPVSAAPRAESDSAPESVPRTEAEASHTTASESPNARRFTEAEIKDFTEINARNVKELEEKLKSLGFEREMIGNNGVVMSQNGEDILFSFINKNTGVRYVFKAGDNKVIPHRIIQTDTNTGKIHNIIEIQRDANGNVAGTIEKNAGNTSTPHLDDDVEVLGVKIEDYFDASPTPEQPLIRKNIRETIEKDFWAETTNLREALGEDFYAQLKWESIIPQNASPQEIQSILSNLNKNAKAFTQLVTLAQKYGRDFTWAENIVKIQDNAVGLVQEGKSFNEVIEQIAKDYGALDVSGSTDAARIKYSGQYRPDVVPNANPTTKCKKGGQYGAYYERFKNIADSNQEIPVPYENAPMTRLKLVGDDVIMCHPTGKYVPSAMKHVETLYNDLKPLVKKVQSGASLTKADFDLIADKISEIHYSLSHAMPWARGSNGIVDTYVRTLYKSLGLDLPALKQNVSLDLEAFCTDLQTFKRNWRENKFFKPTAVEVDDVPLTANQKTGAKPVAEADLAGKSFANESELDIVMSGYEKTIVGDGSKRKIVYFNESGEKFEFVKTTDGKLKLNSEAPSGAKPHADSASQVHDVDSPEALARAKKAADDLFQKVENLQENGFEGVEILNRLTPEERKIFVEALEYDSVNGTFSIFASGEKPGAIFAGSDEFMSLINKIKGNDFDVVNIRLEGDFSFHSGGNENYINNAIVLNKNMTKSVIAENKEFFARRMGLKDNSSVDEIYAKLIAEDGPLKLGSNSDLLGMVLGYPKTSTMIFQLEGYISGDVIQLRYHKDLTPYKKELIKVLYSENSPYKNMSPEFKADLESKINSMTEIKSASDVLGGFDEYPFIYFVDEPSEIARIRGNIERTAQKLDDIPSSKPHADGGAAPQTKSYADMNDEELFAEYFSLRNEVEYSPLSNADKAARIKKMNEITRLLEEQGFEVRMENGQPTKLKKGGQASNEPHNTRLEDRNPAELTDEELYATLDRYRTKTIEKTADGEYRLRGSYQSRYNELKAEFQKRGLEFDDFIAAKNAKRATGLSGDYVLKKFGAKIHNAWIEAQEFISRVTSKETYTSAAAWIKSKFRESELLTDLMIKLERQWAKVQLMRKSADSYTGSKVFDRKALDDFVNEPMNKSVMNIFDETHAKGFELLDENGKPYPKDVVIGMGNPDTYTGKMSFIDPKTGMKYTYGFDNGIMVARERISPNGETMHYATDGRTGKPLVMIRSEEGIVFDKSFTEIKSRQYQTGAGMGGGDAWTNYHVNNANEIPDAIGIHLEKLPNNEQDAIIAALRNGQDYSITMEGKKFTFQIDNRGNIKVSEFNISAAKNREYQQAYKKFNKNQRPVKLEESEFHSDGTLKQDSQYLLDTENLPKLTFIDGTVLDLNRPDIKKAITKLAEGDFLTLGREGMFEISTDMRISSQHILITRNNGKIVMKDISRNGQTYASVNARASQGAGSTGRSNARGKMNESYYEIRNHSEYKQKMADKLNLFSENTQHNIISSLERMGYIRLQKQGVEYIFVKRNGRVQLQEFDIKQKYNVTETKISDIETRTTYEVEGLDDIWWALDDFDSQTRTFMANNLKEGRGCKFDTYDAKYYVSMDANGKITIQKKLKIEPEEPSFSNASRADDASNSNGRRNITPEQKKYIEDANGLIFTKKSEIRGYEQWIATARQKMDAASRLTQAKISEYKSILGITENIELTKDAIKKALRKKSIEFHPDKYQGADADVKMREVNEANEALSNYLDQSSFRQDIDNYNAEIARLNKEIADLEESIRNITG